MPLAKIAPLQSRPMTSSICSPARSTSADGRSTLFRTGHDFEVVFDGQVGVGDGLRLDALRRVDDEQRAFAGAQAARDLVVEVDVARRVDELELVLGAVVRAVA